MATRWQRVPFGGRATAVSTCIKARFPPTEIRREANSGREPLRPARMALLLIVTMTFQQVTGWRYALAGRLTQAAAASTAALSNCSRVSSTGSLSSIFESFPYCMSTFHGCLNPWRGKVFLARCT